MTVLTLLALNGIDFKAQPQEIENFAVKISTARLDVPRIAAWIRAHIQDHKLLGEKSPLGSA